MEPEAESVELQRNRILNRLHVIRGLVLATERGHEVHDVLYAAKTAEDGRKEVARRFDIGEYVAVNIVDLPMRSFSQLGRESLRTELSSVEEELRAFDQANPK